MKSLKTWDEPLVDLIFGVSVNSDEKCQFYLMAGDFYLMAGGKLSGKFTPNIKSFWVNTLLPS